MSDDTQRNDGSIVNTKLLEATLEARKVFITGEIEHKMAREVVQQLHVMAHLSDAPIKLFISSPGGHVESGDMIFDAIRFIKPRVIVIGSGWVASAGALIYAAADKADRYSLPNTRFLLHQPSGGFRGQSSDLEIYAREITIMRDRLNHIFADATGQPIDRIEKDTERDFWLSAEDAVEYGLVGKVIRSESELAL